MVPREKLSRGDPISPEEGREILGELDRLEAELLEITTYANERLHALVRENSVLHKALLGAGRKMEQT